MGGCQQWMTMAQESRAQADVGFPLQKNAPAIIDGCVFSLDCYVRVEQCLDLPKGAEKVSITAAQNIVVPLPW